MQESVFLPSLLPGFLIPFAQWESGRGLPQSKTLAREINGL